jgi:hypothetical protein
MFESSYRINDPNVVSEQFETEFVVLNLLTGTYCSFRNSGDLIWRAIVDGTPPAAIFAALEASANPHAGATRAFVEQVIDLGLVRPDPGAGKGHGNLATIAAIDSPPLLEVFNDLADLIAADPIHDVDEQMGWPRRPI